MHIGKNVGLAFGALFLVAAKPAEPLPGSTISADDYPASALEAHHQGTVRFQLTIATNGRVKACKITQSSGYADLDQVTCKILQRRARFKAAEDDNGNPIEGSYSNSFDWRLAY